jgi:divalent metal cation (Fe/Co/Zn/Cd) transporter
MSSTRAGLQRRALQLEYATIAWNVGEAVFTIGLGLTAGSLALIGFGTDSIIEVFASTHIRPAHASDRAPRTRRALRLVAAAFVVLAVVLAVASGRELVLGTRAGESLVGIVYLAVTAAVMFGLAAMKGRTAAALDSAPLRSEAAMTFLDGVLSTLTLTGLGLNAALGWAWADPAAALFVAVAAANEARQNLLDANEIGGRGGS